MALECLPPCAPNDAEPLPSNNMPPPAPSSVGDISRSQVTADGTVAAGAYQVTFYNAGSTAATVDGVAFAPGQSLTLTAYSDGGTLVRLPAIPYTASATAILDITVVA